MRRLLVLVLIVLSGGHMASAATPNQLNMVASFLAGRPITSGACTTEAHDGNPRVLRFPPS